MKKHIYIALASVLMLLASVSSVFACGIWSYQPKTPKDLQR
jgi:cyclic lactone autoinducer peptide